MKFKILRVTYGALDYGVSELYKYWIYKQNFNFLRLTWNMVTSASINIFAYYQSWMKANFPGERNKNIIMKKRYLRFGLESLKIVVFKNYDVNSWM